MIDLHLHLDGSLTGEEILHLAQLQHIQLDCTQIEDAITAPKHCDSLNEYLRAFELPVSVLQSREAVQYAISALLRRLRSAGMLYAEVRFAPQLHTQRGLKQADVVEAACSVLQNDAQHEGFFAQLILCCMRGRDTDEANLETLRVAEKFFARGVCAIDLAGAEALFPTLKYAPLFTRARQMGIPFTIHAGEADGANSVRSALQFGANRIGHGVRSIEDEKLVVELAQREITLELCPTSNLQTRAVTSFDSYPALKLIEAGVHITLNTDNMTVSQTTIPAEYEMVKKMGATQSQLTQMLNYAVQGAFLPREKKALLLDRIPLALPAIGVQIS